MSSLLLRMTKTVVVTGLLLTTVSAQDAARNRQRRREVAQRWERMQAANRQRQRMNARETLSLAAAPAPGRYAEGAPLPVTLTFKNTGKKRMTFELINRSTDPPGYIQARVRGEGGALLTQNSTLEDGWWTVWVMSSGIMGGIEKEDLITLKPGEEYAHTLNLRALLVGCDRLPDGLKAGTYRVQFSYGKVLSNEVEISIGN